jgi:ribosomal protein S18 acetylase RimI-like enzyme
MNVSIRPLDQETLPATIALVNEVFPRQKWWEKASWALTLSLQPGRVAKLPLLSVGVRWCRYWTALDSEGRIVGVSGLYQPLCCSKTCRLGWTCVAAFARGQGVGKRMLERALGEARRLGASQVELYTTDKPEQAAAVRMYESRGFIRIAESAGKADERHGRYLYFRLEVDRDADPL